MSWCAVSRPSGSCWRCCLVNCRAHSLRDIEASMSSHQARLYHAGGAAPARSTFADANRDRDSRVFSGLFIEMLGMATRGLRRKMGDAVRLIDSTGLRLAGSGAKWARFSAEVCGAKAHVVFDPDLGCPIYHMITEATVNDIVAAKRCRSTRVRPMSSNWAMTTTAGGRRSTRRAAAS